MTNRIAGGTPFYTAPELLTCFIEAKRPADPSEVAQSDRISFQQLCANDVFAFGVVMAAMLNGGEIYEDCMPEDELDFLTAIRAGTKRPALPEDCPLNIKTLIQSCWHHDPNQRPSFYEILLQLETLWPRARGDSEVSAALSSSSRNNTKSSSYFKSGSHNRSQSSGPFRMPLQSSAPSSPSSRPLSFVKNASPLQAKRRSTTHKESDATANATATATANANANDANANVIMFRNSTTAITLGREQGSLQNLQAAH
jgi:hypothetical protein